MEVQELDLWTRIASHSFLCFSFLLLFCVFYSCFFFLSSLFCVFSAAKVDVIVLIFGRDGPFFSRLLYQIHLAMPGVLLLRALRGGHVEPDWTPMIGLVPKRGEEADPAPRAPTDPFLQPWHGGVEGKKRQFLKAEGDPASCGLSIQLGLVHRPGLLVAPYQPLALQTNS